MARSRKALHRAAAGRRDRRHARADRRLGAALPPVLPGDRLWRHDAARRGGAGAAGRPDRSRCASTPMSTPTCPGASSRSQRAISAAGSGEQQLAFYEAVNRSDQPIVGRRRLQRHARSRSAPTSPRSHCFCFEEQVLQPGEKVDMPVSFFVDPAMLDGSGHPRGPRRSRLSYTFFIDEDGDRQAARRERARARPAEMPRRGHGRE